MNETAVNATFSPALLYINTTILNLTNLTNFTNITSYQNSSFLAITYGTTRATTAINASATTQPRPQTNSTLLSTVATTPANVVVSVNVPYMAAELVIAFLSTVGNLLVCAAVGLNRKLHTVTNYFLVSLAVADVCVGALAIPCAILTDTGIPRNNLYLCLLMLSVLIMLTQSSIFSLLAVAVERYVAIFMPFRYHSLMTPRNALLVILVTWVLAFLIGLVPIMGWHKTPPDSGYCFFVLVVDMTYMVYFNFFACVLTPLVVMFLIYAQIFVTVKHQVRRIAAERGVAGGGADGAANIKKEMKTATSLFLVLFLFTVCWIPLHVINCFLLLCPTCPVPLPLLLTAIILSHANSAVNPFLYAYKMKSFREAFKGIFLCFRGVRDGED
ncbi:adenosine receptor A1-like [Astyanax mexicanus]|uniref:Adenosine receptor A1-like n=1 Tax=Astyanax mexicanus TaxID=7994 RepID=A0A8T2MMP1_ASTMX|nr:adenosine receptor A1-like [Astyanax mexicanus]